MALTDSRLQLSANVPLAPLSTLGIGGPARWFVRATSAETVAEAHAWSADHDVPLFVLGGGSNLVLADEGFDGLVLQIGLMGIHVSTAGEETVIGPYKSLRSIEEGARVEVDNSKFRRFAKGKEKPEEP